MAINDDFKRDSENTPAGDLSDTDLQDELSTLVARQSQGEVAGSTEDRRVVDARISDLRAEAAEREQPQDVATGGDAGDFPGSDAAPEAPAD